MNLEKHISDLLYRNDCVVVPNFGAFIGDWQSATVDEVQNNFQPPRKLISFNPKIKNNDGLLANHISLHEKITYVEAGNRINQVVFNWKEKIENKEVLVLDKLGSFSLNSDLNIVFLPNNYVNYLTDSFGLSSFTSQNIQREKEVIKLEETIKDIEVIQPKDVSKKVVQIKKKNNNVLKYAAAVALFSVIGTTSYKFYKDYQVDQQTLAIQERVNKKIQERIQQATFVLPNPITSVDLSRKLDQDTIKKIEEISQTNKELVSDQVVAKNPSKDEAIKSSTGERLPYHVIGAAFQSEINAKKTAKEFVRRGFVNAHILPKNNSGLFPVVYGSFKTRSEAETFIQKIKTEENAEVWLHF